MTDPLSIMDSDGFQVDHGVVAVRRENGDVSIHDSDDDAMVVIPARQLARFASALLAAHVGNSRPLDSAGPG